MNAITETAQRDDRPPLLQSPARSHRAPVSALGFTALGLWIVAVCAGIGAPLLGLEIDDRLVIGVLVAAGGMLLLSLPFTALSRTDKDGGEES